MNYRGEARRHLDRAKERLISEDIKDVRYAALDLRMAMEALTYARAAAYKDEFPPQEYRTWQPRKVMQVLLDIDPYADQGGTLSFGEETEYGVTPKKMKTLGTETVLSMKTLKRYYDAIGSYLHVPTLKQVEEGKQVGINRMKGKCEEVAGYIEKVLASPIYHNTIGSFAVTNCTECEKPIRKRVPSTVDELKAECFQEGCPATYLIIRENDKQVMWKEDKVDIVCGNESCDKKILVWRKEVQQNKYWMCPECGGKNSIMLGVSFDPGAEEVI